MLKHRRPYVLVLRLVYKGHHYDFAIPLRSNIPPATPKSHYFPLPPRKQTRLGHRHGLHYTKMFPVTKEYLERYRVEGNASAELIQGIIMKNRKRIVQECQDYPDSYAAGKRPAYSTDIDYLLRELFE